MSIHAYEHSQKHVESLMAAHVGCVVMLRDVESEKVETYQLVPEWHANPLEGRLSVDSPLGRGLLGREEGEVVEVFDLPRPRQFELLDIEPSALAWEAKPWSLLAR